MPLGRTTLVMGEAGSGKTVFSLQWLVNGALEWKEPGLFVAFEENSRQIVAETSALLVSSASFLEAGLHFDENG